jgi:hypothetical protein
MKILCAVFLLIASVSYGSDVQLHGFKFAETARVQDTNLVLNGTGLLRYFFLKIYVAGLYLGEGVTPDRFFEDVPKRLELGYLRAFSRKQIVEAGEDALKENVEPAVLERIRPQIDQMNALYEDIKEGDRYALTYMPGVGTELALNGARKGVVEGAEFGREYYKIWLGDSRITRDLKAALLKAAAPSAPHSN